MKSILAFAILGVAMLACEFGDQKSGNESGTSNTASSPAKTTATPDKQSVQNELLQFENKMAQASVDGDASFLSDNTTDDFELTGVDGKIQNKSAALADVKAEKRIKTWTITEPDLMSFSDDSAVFRFTLNLTLKTGQSGSARVTDSFVRKNGHWLVKSEQQTMIRK
jgi:hypothetical protein